MVISLKLKLIDKVNGLKYKESSEQGHWYNKAVFSACQRIDEFFNDELVPEVPKYVADWYESNKKNLDYNLWNYVYDWEDQEDDEFKNWFNNSNYTKNKLEELNLEWVFDCPGIEIEEVEE